MNLFMIVYYDFPSSAPQNNGFSQMARMMDSLILDSLQTTPYAYTKITTHRPIKKATSTNHLPTNGLGSSTSTNVRSTFHSSKKIPTQGKLQLFESFIIISRHVLHILSAPRRRDHIFISPKKTSLFSNASFASSQVCCFTLATLFARFSLFSQ